MTRFEELIDIITRNKNRDKKAQPSFGLGQLTTIE